jgi:hypothetical protein
MLNLTRVHLQAEECKQKHPYRMNEIKVTWKPLYGNYIIEFKLIGNCFHTILLHQNQKFTWIGVYSVHMAQSNSFFFSMHLTTV